MDTKAKIKQIQDFSKKILRESGKRGVSLRELAKDNCSEMSRLAGCFALKLWQGSTVYILKGDGVFGKKQSHDILAVQNKGGVYLLDLFIWQVFPKKRNIFIGDVKSMSDGKKLARSIYGGEWSVSEILSLETCKQKTAEWLSVVRRNNDGAC